MVTRFNPCWFELPLGGRQIFDQCMGSAPTQQREFCSYWFVAARTVYEVKDCCVSLTCWPQVTPKTDLITDLLGIIVRLSSQHEGIGPRGMFFTVLLFYSRIITDYTYKLYIHFSTEWFKNMFTTFEADSSLQINHKYICALQLPGEPHRSTRLLQLTGR